MKRALTALSLILVGCGDLVVDTGQSKTATATSTATSTETAAERPQAASEPAVTTDTASCTVTASGGQAACVAVAGEPEARSEREQTADTPQTGDEDGALWLYSDLRKTYYQASADQPDGYRLPTRAEVLAAAESGELAAYTQTVWTGTGLDYREDHAWVVRLKDSWPIDADKEQLHGTLYVKE